MIATYPAFPSWLNPYGATPDAHPCKDGWVLLGLSSRGSDKATFHHRAWRWCYPTWVVTEIPLTERFIHAQLTPIASRLFVYGLAVGGYCFEEVAGFVPYGAPAVLSDAGAALALPLSGSPSPRSFAHELDRAWRRHRTTLKAGT